MQMDSRYPMKRSDKGKRAIIKNEYGRISDDDDELDLDEIFESVHRRMLEEQAYPSSELSVLGGGTSPPMRVAGDEHRRSTSLVHGKGSGNKVGGSKLDATAPAFYMQPKPLGGVLNHEFGPQQTNFSIMNQRDLSSAIVDMNVSGIKSTKELDNRFCLQDDQAQLMQRAYLNKYANSSIDGSSSSSTVVKNASSNNQLNKYAKSSVDGSSSSSTVTKCASFKNHYHNIGSSNSQASNYKQGGYDANSSVPYIPLKQRDSGNFPDSFARGVELQNQYGAQVRHQLYLQSLRASKQHIASQVGEQRALTNSNVEFPEHSSGHNAMVSSNQSPQPKMSLLGKAPATNQGYFVTSGYGRAMPNSGRPLERSIIPSYPHQSVNPMTHGVRESGNSISISNVERSDVSSVIHVLQHTNKTLELLDVAGHFVELCKNSYGSRFILVKLGTASPEEMDIFFHEIRPQALTLMSDIFGNYVIQKLLDYGSKHHIRELANQMTGRVYQLSLEMFSCRVVQKALEVIEVEKRITLVSELEGHVLRLIRDQNGNHVIQKCIENVPENEIQFILSAILEQIISLSTHPYGCRVIQRVLENCHSEKTQRLFMEEITHYVSFLADDLFGNYVVQCVLETGKPQPISNIIKNLTGQIVHMSTLKYASNVVEKCLKYGSLAERTRLVDEMLYFSHECDTLQLLIKDQYGNYVIQKVLEICNEEQLEQILNRIKVHMNALRMDPYARQILLRLEPLVIAGERRHHIKNYH